MKYLVSSVFANSMQLKIADKRKNIFEEKKTTHKHTPDDIIVFMPTFRSELR